MHTPGPWSFVGDWGETGGKRLAHVTENGGSYHVAGVERVQKDDANLISAAPELLEALKETHFYLLGIFEPAVSASGHKYREIMEKIVAAIQKAEGKP